MIPNKKQLCCNAMTALYAKYFGHISIPILEWGVSYRRRHFLGDLTAAVVVVILIIPQCMAYAVLTGVPPIYGLYCATVSPIMYGMFGTSRQLSIAAYSIISLLVVESLVGLGYEEESTAYIQAASSLALLSGLISLLMGVLKLGMVANFMSAIVIEGFIVASAIIIIISQLKSMLGMDVPAFEYPLQTLYYVVVHLDETYWPTLFLSVLSFGLMFYARWWKLRNKTPTAEQQMTDNLRAAKQFCADFNGLLVMCLCMLLAYVFIENGVEIDIVGEVPAGMQSPSLPPVHKLAELLPGAVVVAVITFLSNWSMCVKFATLNGYEVDASQELFASGVANVVGSLFGAFPVAGGLARSAVIHESGGKTGLSSILAGVLIVIALFVLTPAFFYIPKAVLGTITSISVVGMLDTEQFFRAYRVNKKDFVMICVTFCVTLGVGITPGLCAGILTSLLAVLYTNSFPDVAVLGVLKDGTYDEFMHGAACGEALQQQAAALTDIMLEEVASPQRPFPAAVVRRTQSLFRLLLSDRARFLSCLDTNHTADPSDPQDANQLGSDRYSHLPGVALLRMQAALFFANSLLFKTAVEDAVAGRHLREARHRDTDTAPYSYLGGRVTAQEALRGVGINGAAGYEPVERSESFLDEPGCEHNAQESPTLPVLPTKLLLIDVGGWNDADVVGTTLLCDVVDDLASPKQLAKNTNTNTNANANTPANPFGTLVAFVNCYEGSAVHRRLVAAGLGEETLLGEAAAGATAEEEDVEAGGGGSAPAAGVSVNPGMEAPAQGQVRQPSAAHRVPIVYHTVADALRAFPRRWRAHCVQVRKLQTPSCQSAPGEQQSGLYNAGISARGGEGSAGAIGVEVEVACNSV